MRRRIYFNSHFKVQSIVARKARLQVLGVAGPIASAIRKPRTVRAHCCSALLVIALPAITSLPAPMSIKTLHDGQARRTRLAG